MKTDLRRNWLVAASLGLGVLAACMGCHGTHDLVGLPEPAGTAVNTAADIQAQNAAQDDFVIYYSEWLDETTVLGPFGKRHLERIAKCLPGAPCPVIIEPTGLVDLDRSRREAIVTVLGMKGIADAEQRVVIDYPRAEGLYGDEAERAYEGMLNPNGNYGRGGNGFNSNPLRRHVGNGPWWGDMFGGSRGRGGWGW